MKEPLTAPQDEIQIISQAEINKYKLIKRAKLTPGHTLWELNCETGDLVKATYEQRQAYFDGQDVEYRSKVILKDNCFYFGALNQKNALKRVNQILNGTCIAIRK